VIPDLGSYAGPVLAAYGVTLALLLGVVALSWLQARRARARLAEAEARLRAKARPRPEGDQDGA
jgi:heme exporter protein D